MIEEHITALEGGSKKDTSDKSATSLIPPHEDELHGTEDFHAVKAHIADNYGTKEDGLEEALNEKLSTFLEEMGEVNFYTYTTLMEIDTSPGSDVASFRSRCQLLLLPCFQIVMPWAMVWYFLVNKDLVHKHGFCCNHTGVIFRFTGFVAFMYSAWQIIDGDNDPSAKFFLRHSVKQWALTGGPVAWQGTWMFFLGNLSQQLAAFAILVLTYVIFTYQCDTPLDLVMNCVAINFVLGIDSEWMNDQKQAKSVQSAKMIYGHWRDRCHEMEEEARYHMRLNQALRKTAPQRVEMLADVLSTIIWVFAYFLVVTWTICPGNY